ncbi:MAG: DUF4037 domain-containing protein [Clostridia bacterium]|nr:DUF4037 domain-containing protein [Clostridia bacterium]
MKGLELSERFYVEYGAPMLNGQFADIASLLAVGLFGSGSECFGYDDNLSADHDLEPGFCIILPDEDVIDRQTEFALERAYYKLPREFMGYKRSTINPAGGNRHGVARMRDFLLSKTGTPDGVLPTRAWFSIPEQSLAEATNGKIFRDDSGKFTAARQRLAYLPEDVRRKKLAGHLLLMGQAGQYNYPRSIARGDTAAAQLAVIEFAKSALHAVFLLNSRYIPYYKWSFRALSELPTLSTLYSPLEYLISSGNKDGEATTKQAAVNEICAAIISTAKEQGLTDFAGEAAEGHALAINRRIADEKIRNLHILYGV